MSGKLILRDESQPKLDSATPLAKEFRFLCPGDMFGSLQYFGFADILNARLVPAEHTPL